MTDLIPIGVFARATGLSVRMLRNYDRTGLLRPADVDPDTGYRRYSVGQFARAGLIRRLRTLEVPLSDIAEIVAAADPGSARAAIERHRDRVAGEAARLADVAARLDTVLDDPADALAVYERTRDRTPIARLAIRTTIADLATVLGPGFGELFAGVGALGVAVTGPPGCRHLVADPTDAADDGVAADAELTVELFVPIAGRPRPAGRVTPAELPASLLVATVHNGPYDTIDAAYRALARRVAEHGATVRGPAEETYLVAPGPGVEPGALRTEVAWPVGDAP